MRPLRILLHIGTPKAGSTAIQHACRAFESQLLEAGILYPKVNSSAVSHKFLAFALCTDEELPGHFRNLHKGKVEKKNRLFREEWDHICQQVNKYKPHTLLLSTEHLFDGFTNGRGEKLKEVLTELSDDVEVICYVRRPSAYYLSLTQQILKSSAAMPAPKPVSYRGQLEQCISLFKRIHVVPFEREQLKGGDVVHDFFERFLPHELLSVLEGWKGARNETLTAESMAILQDYRLLHHGNKNREKVIDSKRLLVCVRISEALSAWNERPKLKPEVSDFIDHSSTDLIWLRDRYGILFAGVDYSKVGERNNNYISALKVDEICQVSGIQLQRIQLHALRILLVWRIPLPFTVIAWLYGSSNGVIVSAARRWLGVVTPRSS